ncbi:MFS general substrate transporter [Stipitochalara longipes BDJ]|nr:MFS general substrate transporter [Stipitochalara longipes BDJ]
MSESSQGSLRRWRMNLPVIQALILCIVIFLVPGMNSLVVGLGAGGSHPSNIEVVDRINLVSTAFMILSGILGGNVNNQLGPRYTLMFGVSGYPLYMGSLWWLDQGRSPTFAYFAAVYKGLCGGLLYTIIGYISTSYAQERNRGIYIGAISSAFGIGSVVGSALVLGLTAHRSKKSTHVPSNVYVSIVTLQSIGFLVASLLENPSKVCRKDGKAITQSLPKTWREELMSLPRSIMTPSVLLMSIAIFSCQMIFSLTGSLNAFYFNARTRALANFSFWLASACASLVFGFVFDSKWLGNRRRRSTIAAALVAALLLGSHSGLLWFLATHTINRQKAPFGIDWSDGNAFGNLLVVYIFVGFSSNVFQNYLLWLLATFTNDPTVLSLFSGYIEALKAMGVLTSFAIDSKRTSFLTEEISYFALNVVGLVVCTVSAVLYTRDSIYEEERSMIVPSLFQVEMVSHKSSEEPRLEKAEITPEEKV